MAYLFLSYISKEKLQSEEESDNPGKVEDLNSIEIVVSFPETLPNLYLNTIKYIFHYRILF